jgi:aryl-alcohol dehydrogenase-like predicted oxidoreductase
MGTLIWSPLGGGWLSGKYRTGKDVDMSKGRAARMPARFDPEKPGNARKLDAIEDLVALAEQTGTKLTHLAVAFSIAHPAVTSAIVGPRTMEQLTDLLDGAELSLDDDVLDRIDDIVEPGTNLNAEDDGWTPPALADTTTRRRPLSDRGAA